MVRQIRGAPGRGSPRAGDAKHRQLLHADGERASPSTPRTKQRGSAVRSFFTFAFVEERLSPGVACAIKAGSACRNLTLDSAQQLARFAWQPTGRGRTLRTASGSSADSYKALSLKEINQVFFTQS